MLMLSVTRKTDRTAGQSVILGAEREAVARLRPRKSRIN